MAYNDGEALISTRIQALDSFDSTNVYRGNFKPLNTGKASVYAILVPGQPEVEWRAMCSYTIKWITVVKIYERYIDDGTTQQNLATHLSEIFAVLNYPYMGDQDTVQDSTIIGIGEPLEIRDANGNGPFFLNWDIFIQWEEDTNVTFAE